MITLAYEILSLEKRVPLTISRGTITHSRVVWLRLRADGAEGWGETTEFAFAEVDQSLPVLERGLAVAATRLRDCDPWARTGIEGRLREAGVPSAVIAGVDQALWDWAGCVTGRPVAHWLGFAPAPTRVTSVTVGIAPPAAAQERVRQWLELGDIRAFKIKLGSPAGLAADQTMFAAVQAAVPAGVKLSVDANGGWSLADAVTMSRWLADRGVDHLEQPLPRGREAELKTLRAEGPLPVILDESIFTSADVPRLVALGALDGVNIKLMKCGGLTEALRVVAVARAHGLRILVGCYGHTALGNVVAAALSPLVDYLDLDSHLNLKADPFQALPLAGGGLALPAGPGFAISHATTSR